MAMAVDGRPFVPPFPGSSLEPPRLQLRWGLPERAREREKERKKGREKEGEALEEKEGTMHYPTGVFTHHRLTQKHEVKID